MGPLFSLILMSTTGALLLACIFFIALAFNAPRKAFRIAVAFICGAVIGELLTLGVYTLLFPLASALSLHIPLFLGAIAINPLIGGCMMLRLARKRGLLSD